MSLIISSFIKTETLLRDIFQLLLSGRYFGPYSLLTEEEIDALKVSVFFNLKIIIMI